MKRIDQTWWKGSDGYYREVARHTYEGPFPTMDEPQSTESNTVECGPVELVKSVVDKPDES